MAQEYDRWTDKNGHTDIITANVALNYTAWPKNVEQYNPQNSCSL